MANDNVNHPSHYTQGGIECIEGIRASMSPSGFQDYCKGNVLKYIWRWRDKGGIEDLAKAQVYLTWLIDSATKESEAKKDEDWQPWTSSYSETVSRIGSDDISNINQKDYFSEWEASSNETS